MHPPLKAFIWDYDNTLVDTRQRNFNVARRIIADVTGKDPSDFAFLASLECYLAATSRAASWRTLYRAELGLSEDQTDTVGRLWTDYQRNDQTPVIFFPEIAQVLDTYRESPHGIVSQNSSENIALALQSAGWQGYFRHILGFEEVDIRKQKPHPDGLLICLEKITDLQPGIVVSIGDHETDIQSAVNANLYFAQEKIDIRVVSIWAAYGSFGDRASWSISPDFVANRIDEIHKIVRGL